MSKIGLKFNPTGNLALKLTVGQYSQFLYTINQEEELLRIVDFWQPIPKGGSVIAYAWFNRFRPPSDHGHANTAVMQRTLMSS